MTPATSTEDFPKNEKATGKGGSLIGATVIEGRVGISAGSVKRAP